MSNSPVLSVLMHPLAVNCCLLVSKSRATDTKLHPSSLNETKLINSEFITASSHINRKFTSHPKKSIVINTVGVDRPGIVSDVTRIITGKGGNVGASQAQLLGGHFSLMMIVEIASSDVDSLHEQLLNGVKGMSTSCFDVIDPKKVVLSPRIGCE